MSTRRCRGNGRRARGKNPAGWKNVIVQKAAVAAALCVTAGCCLLVSGWISGDSPEDAEQSRNGVSGETDQRIVQDAAAAEIAALCCDLYEEAAAQDNLVSVETVRRFVDRLGQNGYVAVDSENQIDMTEAEQVQRFCSQVDSGEEGALTIIEVSYLGEFAKYDMRTRDGEVDIIKSCYQMADGKPKGSAVRYTAQWWEYTQEGYLFFGGSCFTEDYYALYLSDAPIDSVMRVLPLDESCRELNRRYIAPIGYGRNDLFLSDWSEEDFGETDFYDLYDIFYGLKYNRYVPYRAGENAGTGTVYRIPEEEFEEVIMTYLDIDEEVLRSKTKYISEAKSYEYRPRGFFDAEYPEVPYPEVVGCRENDDGTITLTVNAVYPKHRLSKAYAHEVVIRQLEDGGVQYVSNRILPTEGDFKPTWHVSRLTEEEWERVYGGQDGNSGD